jgi:hypothetical protein
MLIEQPKAGVSSVWDPVKEVMVYPYLFATCMEDSSDTHFGS